MGDDMALKTLHVPDHEIDYPDDVAEIRKELERQGYTASNSAIAWAYSEWSEQRITIAITGHEQR